MHMQSQQYLSHIISAIKLILQCFWICTHLNVAGDQIMMADWGRWAREVLAVIPYCSDTFPQTYLCHGCCIATVRIQIQCMEKIFKGHQSLDPQLIQLNLRICKFLMLNWIMCSRIVYTVITINAMKCIIDSCVRVNVIQC